jgi:hypothetical protein
MYPGKRPTKTTATQARESYIREKLADIDAKRGAVKK